MLALLACIMALSVGFTAPVAEAASPDPANELMRLEGRYALGQYPRALDGLEQLLSSESIDPQLRLQALVLQGRCYVQMDKAAAARDAFKEALAIDFAWQPDPQLFTNEELVVFNAARAESSPTVISPSTDLNCPSSTPSLVASGVFAGSLIWYFSARSTANTRWDEYESDPERSQELYDSYDDAYSTQKLASYVSVATGAATAYLWWRYIDGKKECREVPQSGSRTQLLVSPQVVAVSYRF